MGSPYVPLDSSVYPAIEKLEGMGYIKIAFLALKPWTRIETANLVTEAKSNLEADENAHAGVAALELRLEQEFSYEMGLLDGQRNETAKIESIHARSVAIAGPALTDSDHSARPSPTTMVGLFAAAPADRLAFRCGRARDR